MIIKMKCSRIQDDPKEFLNHEFTPDSLSIIGKHLRSCPDCSQILFNTAFESLTADQQKTFSSLVNIKKQNMEDINVYSLLGEFMERTDESIAKEVFEIRQFLTNKLFRFFIGKEIEWWGND